MADPIKASDLEFPDAGKGAKETAAQAAAQHVDATSLLFPTIEDDAARATPAAPEPIQQATLGDFPSTTSS
ncbi:MAG: hypothetical protein UHD09_03570, partial [Bifidobacterium sp.]|nr:hypothetical protein [Bifidobacterium sp.]